MGVYRDSQIPPAARETPDANPPELLHMYSGTLYAPPYNGNAESNS